jgi:hypothetical protein
MVFSVYIVESLPRLANIFEDGDNEYKGFKWCLLNVQSGTLTRPDRLCQRGNVVNMSSHFKTIIHIV